MANRQEVISLALPPHLRAKVLEAGFRTVGDLERVRGPLDLARGA